MRSKKKSQNRQNSGSSRFVGLPNGRVPRLIGSATNLSAANSVYPKMVKWDIPIIPQFYTMTAGNLAVALATQMSTLCSLQGTLLALFNEYCVVGFKYELRVNATANPSGLIVVSVDEESGAAATAAVFAQAHLEIMVTQTESPSRHLVSWRASDYLDLQWTPTSSGADVPSWLKLFASTAAAPNGTGTTGTSTCQIAITGSLAVCFRGFSPA